MVKFIMSLFLKGTQKVKMIMDKLDLPSLLNNWNALIFWRNPLFSFLFECSALRSEK